MRIVEEFLYVTDGIDDTTRHWLVSQGVPPGIIEVSPGPITTATIEVDDFGCFQFAESGKRALVHPITSGGPFTDIVDLIAWHAENPRRWWTRFYSGLPLGADQLDRAELLSEPLLLHQTPLDWLCAGGDGVCVIDWLMTAPALRLVPILIAEDAEHGREIQRRLTVVAAAPEIRITREAA